MATSEICPRYQGTCHKSRGSKCFDVSERSSTWHGRYFLRVNFHERLRESGISIRPSASRRLCIGALAKTSWGRSTHRTPSWTRRRSITPRCRPGTELTLSDLDRTGRQRAGRGEELSTEWQDDGGIRLRGFSGGIPPIGREDLSSIRTARSMNAIWAP